MLTNNRGFTLIEMLIAVFVSMVIMGGAYAVFRTQQQNTTTQTNVSDIQQTLRASLGYMMQDLRMAGYDPEDSGNFGIVDIQFRTLNDATNAAGNSFIRFSWDKNSNGTLDGDETIDFSLVDGNTISPGIADLYYREPNNTNQRDVLGSNIIALGLAYAIDSDNDNEIDPAGSAINWMVDAGNDGNWDQLNLATGATAATGISVDPRNIRAVRIWLLAQSEAPDPNITDTTTYIVGPHVIQPNNNFRHKLVSRTVLCRNMGL